MFYRIIQIILCFFCKIFFRLEVVGAHHIPTQGAVIITSNHVSFWDPPVIGISMSRVINFMAKEELFAIPVFGWVIKKLNAFPIRRGSADRAAIRTALNILASGEVLGIFPEGTRSKTGQLGKAEPGLALIVAKSGATVIPAALSGTDKIFSIKHGFLPKVKVNFGKPLVFATGKADKQALETISGMIMAEIARLREE